MFNHVPPLGMRPITAEDGESLLAYLNDIISQVVQNGSSPDSELLENVANFVTKIQNLQTDQAPINKAVHRLFEEYREGLLPFFQRDDLSQSELNSLHKVFPFFCLMHLQSNMCSQQLISLFDLEDSLREELKEERNPYALSSTSCALQRLEDELSRALFPHHAEHGWKLVEAWNAFRLDWITCMKCTVLPV